MSITFLLFLDHYFLKDEKKYTSGSEVEPIRKCNVIDKFMLEIGTFLFYYDSV